MKSLTIKRNYFLIIIFLFISVKGSAQAFYTDVATGAAVVTQTETLGNELEKSRKAQQATSAANLTMTVLVDSIRSYDKIMLNYLQKANDVFTGIFHAADAIEMGGHVLQNIGNCVTAAKNHPKGAIITTLVNTRYTKIIAEIGSLTANIANFVRASGNKNLINSAERLQILYDVHMRMRKLNREVTSLYWEIKTLEWTDLGRMINPDLYYAIQTDERLYKEAKRRIDQMGRAWD